MKKRLAAILLVLALAASVMPAAMASGWTEPDVPNNVRWSGTTLDGVDIDSSTYKGQVQVLIFFRANGVCFNSNYTLEALNTAGWTSDEDVRVVAFGVGEYGESMDTVREHTETMRDTYAPDAVNVDFVPVDNSTLWSYVRQCGFGNSITYALVLVVDRDNTIRCAWQGAYGDYYYHEAIDYVLDRQVEPGDEPGPDIYPGPDDGDPDEEEDPEPDDIPDTGYDTGSDDEYTVTVTGQVLYDYAYEVADQVNELRASLGLRELTVDSQLMDVAMERAAECAVYYDHTRPNGTACFTLFPQRWGTSAENIAMGQGSPDSVMYSWTNSPGHYANMTNSGVNAIGVGCFEMDGVLHWVQCFTGGDIDPDNGGGTDSIATYDVNVTGSFFDMEDWYEPLSMEVGDSEELRVSYFNKGFHFYSMEADYVEGLTASVDGSAVTVQTDPLTVTAVSSGTAIVTVTAPDGDTATLTVEVAPEASFTDVPDDAPYRDAVVWAIRNGVTNGTGNNTFTPDRTVNRAELVTFLWRAMEEPEAMFGTIPFTDLDMGRDSYALDAIAWAVEEGITDGTGNNMFSPTNPCTRAQVVTMLYRAFGKPRVTGQSGFTDVLTGEYYADAVTWAVKNDIVARGSVFGPNEPCSRADVVTYLYNALA